MAAEHEPARLELGEQMARGHVTRHPGRGVPLPEPAELLRDASAAGVRVGFEQAVNGGQLLRTDEPSMNEFGSDHTRNEITRRPDTS